MWDFFSKPLQNLVTAVLTALFFFLVKLITDAYKKDRQRTIRHALRVAFVASELVIVFCSVNAGLIVSSTSSRWKIAAQWFPIMFLFSGRLFQIHSFNRSDRVTQANRIIKAARAEDGGVKKDQVIVDLVFNLYETRPSWLVIYLMYSTATWITIFLYLALFWRIR